MNYNVSVTLNRVPPVQVGLTSFCLGVFFIYRHWRVRFWRIILQTLVKNQVALLQDLHTLMKIIPCLRDSFWRIILQTPCGNTIQSQSLSSVVLHLFFLLSTIELLKNFFQQKQINKQPNLILFSTLILHYRSFKHSI